MVYSRNVLAELHKGLSWLPKGTQVCCFIFKDNLLKVKKKLGLSDKQKLQQDDRRPAQTIEELLPDLKHKQKGTQKQK